MQQKGFSLKAIQEKTPVVDPVEAMRKAMLLGLSGAVKEGDAVEMIAKLKEMALAGNLKAMDMWFKLTMGDKPAQAEKTADDRGMKLLAETMRDIVDEIRIAKAKTVKHRVVVNGKDDDEDDD